MTKKELEQSISLCTGMRLKDVQVMMEAFTSLVKNAVYKKEEVHLRGFGVFTSKNYKGHTRKHPKTKEMIEIKGAVVPVFRAARNYREFLNS